jgi:hypothetical protein
MVFQMASADCDTHSGRWHRDTGCVFKYTGLYNKTAWLASISALTTQPQTRQRGLTWPAYLDTTRFQMTAIGNLVIPRVSHARLNVVVKGARIHPQRVRPHEVHFLPTALIM